MVHAAINSQWMLDEDYEDCDAPRRVSSPRKEKQAYSTRYVRRRAKTPALSSGVHRRRIKKGCP